MPGARLEFRRNRRQTTGRFRLKRPVWVDPFPTIPGTEPEKRLFEVLVRRRLYFVFQDYLPDYSDPKTKAFLYNPDFQPDIRLPEYRLIFDPFGIYHHSRPDQVLRDRVKSVVYRQLGYEFIHPWWDNDGFLLENNGTWERVGFDAEAVLESSERLRMGPRWKLTDPRDIAAKKFPGYRLGKALGAGASSVALVNHLRRRQHAPVIKGAGRRRVRRHV